MDTTQRTVPLPKAQVVVQRAARGQILRHRPPLAARAEHIHQPVHHLPQIDRAPTAAALARRDQAFNKTPFRIRQITWIAQAAPVITPSVLVSPHAKPSSESALDQGITTDSANSRTYRTDTKSKPRCSRVNLGRSLFDGSRHEVVGMCPAW